MYLSTKASAQQVRPAEQARRNRHDIIKAFSEGQVSRRDLFRWGLFTAGGGLALKNGLSPFIGNAYGEIPTGVPRSVLLDVKPSTAPMPRCDLMERKAISALSPAPQRMANTNSTKVAGPDGTLVNGPMEGRPPGEIWAHQGWEMFAPKVAVEQWQKGAEPCYDYHPGVDSYYNCGIDPSKAVNACFHPDLPTQNLQSLWTFGGTAPLKLLLGRYGEPIIFRHHNALPAKVNANGGFGRNTISTHEHNGHHGAESDGFTDAFFFPRPILRLPLAHRSCRLSHHQHHGERPEVRRAGRLWRHHQAAGGLARDHEQ